jgi:hypothetical protein
MKVIFALSNEPANEKSLWPEQYYRDKECWINLHKTIQGA